LYSRELDVERESFGEVESSESGEEIENDMVIEHVVGVRVETFHVEGREEISDIGRNESYGKRGDK